MKKIKCKLFKNRKLYCTGFGYISRKELAYILKDDQYDVQFEEDGAKILMSVLKEIEPVNDDTKMLAKIVREGGFTSYIKKLENNN